METHAGQNTPPIDESAELQAGGHHPAEQRDAALEAEQAAGAPEDPSFLRKCAGAAAHIFEMIRKANPEDIARGAHFN